jgi:MFS family permease
LSTDRPSKKLKLTHRTAIAHESWIEYMNNPSEGLTGAVRMLQMASRTCADRRQVVAVYIAGEAVGALFQTAVADKLGRLRFMELMCVIVTIGTTIQTASVNIGMFLAGRALAGIAVG